MLYAYTNKGHKSVCAFAESDQRLCFSLNKFLFEPILLCAIEIHYNTFIQLSGHKGIGSNIIECESLLCVRVLSGILDNFYTRRVFNKVNDQTL